MCNKYEISKKQARIFLLLKHGLIGQHRFQGESGVLDFLSQIRCIQFDPIDICGKSPELVLFSRVSNFDKQMLYDLLYLKRTLIDYFDKNLCIFLTEDWHYFSRARKNHENHEKSIEKINEVCEAIKTKISQEGALCSKDLNMNEKVCWYWNNTKLSRAALEHMYFSGQLVIHHKKGNMKYYDLVEKCLKPRAYLNPEPFNDEFQYMKWRVLRRIQSVGLLWNRGSDAWLGISGLRAKERNEIFSSLLEEGKIVEINVKDLPEKLYCTAEDLYFLNYTMKNPKLKKRCEFIAPLDNMMWDRKLIKELFNFEYKWEVYTPISQRKYGHYVLPILYGDKFIGRIEPVYDRKNKTLAIKNIWLESEITETEEITTVINEKVNELWEFNKKEIITL